MDNEKDYLTSVLCQRIRNSRAHSSVVIGVNSEFAVRGGRTYMISAGTHGQVTTVKIGRADDPAQRLRELQTGNPHKLELLAVFPNSGQTAELALHRRYARYATGGGREWFALPVAELEVLRGLREPGDPVPHYLHVTDHGFEVALYHPAELARLRQIGDEELKWALANRYFRMNYDNCAHALYLSECTSLNIPCVPGGDHSSVWVPDPATITMSETDGCAPFVLDQPYHVEDLAGAERYAVCFGLVVSYDTPFRGAGMPDWESTERFLSYGDNRRTQRDNWHSQSVVSRRFWPENRITPLDRLLMKNPPVAAEWPDYSQEAGSSSEYGKLLRGDRHPQDHIGWHPWSGWERDDSELSLG